ncbi:MAG: FtsX-like permease family protein [Thermomicrobiaceae bacterium]|nr:FtsX-like permease family protein [Thermomicrobiaceae bacterium]
MEKIFGIPIGSLMVALLIAFGLCLGVGAWIALRQRVIFKMGIRNVPRRPAQTTLIIIGLMLSTLIISAALTTGDTLNSSLTGTVNSILGQTDEFVVKSSDQSADQANPRSGVTFPTQVATDLAAKLAGDPDVDGVMGVLSEPVPTINPRTKLSEPALNATGLDPAAVGRFGGLKEVDGKAVDLASFGPNDIALGEKPAGNLDARVGDTLQVYVANQPHQVTVRAIVQDSVLSGSQDLGDAGGFAMPLTAAQALLGHPGQISYVAISNAGGVEDGAALSDAVVAKVNGELQGSGFRAIPVKQRALDQSKQGGEIFTSVFLVLGSFSIAAGILLIFLIFVLLAAERKPEMGMARAVGMKRRQLMQMFLAEGLAYDLLSALVGAALGVGVAFVIAGVLGQLVGQYFSITPVASWRSLIVAYTMGVVVTFLTIVGSSWRVSKLNIVSAIRDIPEPAKQRESRRWLIFGILGILVGALLLWVGVDTKKAFPFAVGISLVPLSLAVALRRFGLPGRLLYTVASLFVLAYWLAPTAWLDRIHGKLDGGMEMFAVSGIMMVAAATVAVVWNAEILASLVGYLGRTFSRWLPAVKTAVAYPLSSKGRTGLTIAMFSLIVFSLVTMATISANFSAMFTGKDTSGGWDIEASQAPTNPIPDFLQALQAAGVDTSRIAAIGRVERVPSYAVQIRMAGASDWKQYAVNGVDASFIDHFDAPLQTRARGYDSDRAVWDAVRNDPNLAVVDAGATFGNNFGGPPSMFHIDGVTQGDKTMEPARVEIADPATGKTRAVTIVGVIDSKVQAITGLFLQRQTFDQIFETPAQISYYAQVKDGADATALAKSIEAGLITYGIQADSIPEMVKEANGQAQGFLYLIEGFMGLGLVVGIAALGVVSFRSVVERRQQIGMLRAIGYQRGMVAASFLIESLMITLMGVLSGAGLGLLLAHKLMTSADFSGSAGNAFVVPWGQVSAFLAIALAAALLMSYIPSRKAATVPIAEALRYE